MINRSLKQLLKGPLKRVDSCLQTQSDVDIKVEDNGNGTFNVFYSVKEVGDYTINVNFGGNPVPGGSFTMKVSPSLFGSLFNLVLFVYFRKIGIFFSILNFFRYLGTFGAFEYLKKNWNFCTFGYFLGILEKLEYLDVLGIWIFFGKFIKIGIFWEFGTFFGIWGYFVNFRRKKNWGGILVNF